VCEREETGERERESGLLRMHRMRVEQHGGGHERERATERERNGERGKAERDATCELNDSAYV